MNTIKIEKQNTKMVAHRGVSGLEKENTSLAFVAAGNRSYWGIETDVHITADKNVIVIHDDHTTRVTGVARTVEECDYDTLRAMTLLDFDGSAGRTDLRMPSLEEYVRICKKYEKVCVLELKNLMAEAHIEMILSRIEAENYLEHTVFISFQFENLVRVRKLKPEQTVQFLFSEFTDEILQNVKDHRMDVDVYYKALTRDRVMELHAAGIMVNCWTVNDPEVGKTLASWGVDYITTNILE